MAFSGVRLVLAATVAITLAAAPALAREIRIVGSSTVFPFTTTVAEQFGANTRFSTPIVEGTGSGSGLRLFCDGVGLSTPDIANSSRRMMGSEWDRCQSNRVTDIVEVKIGYDGIVLANAKRAETFDLTPEQIFLALAREVPVYGRLVPNPYQRWSDISADLPDLPILVFGPPPSSGTRDAFLELAMEPGARAIPLMKEIEEDDSRLFVEIAHALREDGAWVDAGEDDGAIVQRVARDPTSLGVFGFSFLIQNEDRVRGARVAGTLPSFENIASGEYAIARSMYFYLKKAHVGVVEGLAEFVHEFTDERAWGDEGYLIDKGLIPLPRGMRAEVAESSRALVSMAERPR